MNRKMFLLIGIAVVGLVALMFILFRPGAAQEGQFLPADQPQQADPQRLQIPRWFLRSLTLNGREIPIAEDQQEVTLQFVEDGSANGTASCNSFFTTYEAGPGGTIQFGPIGATKMMCDKIDLENDYFQALANIERFNTENYQLTLSSADERTILVFAMPSK